MRLDKRLVMRPKRLLRKRRRMLKGMKKTYYRSHKSNPKKKNKQLSQRALGFLNENAQIC